MFLIKKEIYIVLNFIELVTLFKNKLLKPRTCMSLILLTFLSPIDPILQ